ncbi:hypothetical protein NAT69_15595 [Pseudomonas stutzeri]|jgi:hypothetical protein|uniref:hypothetical protein n=1 Tax=Stutzerimonas stutzeri TaxID=316 RepID=UPI001CFED6E4|nr:hypothetical protein [Stutzerimonas stutzeri]MCQ4292626.1 hypothetical protein [Stutzerimonas stutzeri]
MCIVVVLLRDHDRRCGEPRTDVLFTRPLLWRTGLEQVKPVRRCAKTDRPARHSARLEKIKQLFQSNDCI